MFIFSIGLEKWVNCNNGSTCMSWAFRVEFNQLHHGLWAGSKRKGGQFSGHFLAMICWILVLGMHKYYFFQETQKHYDNIS